MTSTETSPTAAYVAHTLAQTVRSPEAVVAHFAPQQWPTQSLAKGAAGIALLAVERAATGDAPWAEAHRWINEAARGGVNAATDAHLFYGAPALAFAITGAHRMRPDSYHHALASLDGMTSTIVRARLSAAHARIDARQLPALSEFDTIRGLAGFGAHLLRRAPSSTVLRDIAAYLVRLTEPIHDDGDELPGWWTNLNPAGNQSQDFPGGHANTGMAHGIGGPLALLAFTATRGITVPGHFDAIGRIRAWLDRWRRTSPAGDWWPYWVTRSELRSGQLDRPGPQRPSWCYGTAGLARSQQLAAIATGDREWQQSAEAALADALTDPHQLGLITDNSLCHGRAGLAHIARSAAIDSTSGRLNPVAEQVVATAAQEPVESRRSTPGFLEGAAGTAAALHASATRAPTATGWDTCLLVNAPA